MISEQMNLSYFPIQLNFNSMLDSVNNEYRIVQAHFENIETNSGGNAVYCSNKKINLRIDLCIFNDLIALPEASHGSALRIEKAKKIEVKCSNFVHNTCYDAHSIWITDRSNERIDNVRIEYITSYNCYVSSSITHHDTFGAIKLGILESNYTNNEAKGYGIIIDYPQNNDCGIMKYMHICYLRGGDSYIYISHISGNFCIEKNNFIENNIDSFLACSKAITLSLYNCNFLFSTVIPSLTNCFIYNSYIDVEINGSNIIDSESSPYIFKFNDKICQLTQITCQKKASKRIAKYGILMILCLKLK